MTLERRFRIALLVTAVISLLAFGAAEQSAGLSLLAVAGATAGWWVTERQGAGSTWKGLPRWVSSAVLLVMLLVAVWRALQGQGEVVSAFTGFLASIIVVKLCERRELRDYAQILTMALFMTVGATLNNNSLLIGALLLVQVPVFVTAVMLFQLFAAGERVRATSWRGESFARGDGAAPEGPTVWAPLRRAFAGTVGTSVLAGVVIAATVFVLVPRGIGLHQWGEFAMPRGGQTTGFTDEVEPGAGEVISVSQVAVMEVGIKDETGKSLGSVETPYYLRGAVLDQYDPIYWKWTKILRSRPANYQIKPTDTGQSLLIVEKPPEGTRVYQDFKELAGVKGDTPMFALYQPISVTVRRTDPVQDINFDSQAGWITRHGDGSRLVYQITSILGAKPSENVERPLGVTFPSEKIRELASDLLRQSRFEPDPARRPFEDDGRAARVFETYLRNNYEYTLTPGPAPGGESPTEYFLFTSKKGHCEYFASALAAMCRSVGIDARVVAGYLANEYHADDGVYVVRASDAHAWVEVNAGPGGWQQRDATPADGRRSESSRGTLSARFGRVVAAVQDLWNATVVTFDQTAQEKLLGQSADGPQRRTFDLSSRSLRRLMARLRSPAREPGALAARAMLVGAVFLAVGMAWVGWRALRRRMNRSRSDSGWAMMGAERRVYRALLGVLSDRGYAKPGWLPPMQHLREVQAKDAEFAQGAGEVVSLLYRARFGGGNGKDVTAAMARLKVLRTTRHANGKA
jgi:protein-glutamine gamma-glutamyltransferase